MFTAATSDDADWWKWICEEYIEIIMPLKSLTHTDCILILCSLLKSIRAVKIIYSCQIILILHAKER